MQNITLSADEALIASARQRAAAENTTLNAQFRLWLESYARQSRLQRFDETMAGLQGKLQLGRKFTRDEMNER